MNPMEQFRQAYEERMKEQQGSVDGMKEQLRLAVEAQDQGKQRNAIMDGLAMFSDANFGTNYQQGRTMDRMENEKKIQNLQGAIQKGEGQLANQRLGLLKQDADMQMAQKKLDAQKIANQSKAGEKVFDNTQKLRKEWSSLPTTKDTQAVAAAYNKVQMSAKDPSAAGDLSLIFNYMKMLDPGSVVREGEFATAQNAAGVPDRLRNYYNQVKDGRRLGRRQRMDFVNQSGKVWQAQKSLQDQIDDDFTKLAQQHNLSPEQVLLTINAMEPTAMMDIQAPEQSIGSQNLLQTLGIQEAQAAPMSEQKTVGKNKYRRVEGGWELIE